MSVIENRPNALGYIMAMIGPQPRPQWALCMKSFSGKKPYSPRIHATYHVSDSKERERSLRRRSKIL